MFYFDIGENKRGRFLKVLLVFFFFFFFLFWLSYEFVIFLCVDYYYNYVLIGKAQAFLVFVNSFFWKHQILSVHWKIAF